MYMYSVKSTFFALLLLVVHSALYLVNCCFDDDKIAQEYRETIPRMKMKVKAYG